MASLKSTITSVVNVFTAEDFLPPFAVVEVPFDSFLNALIEECFRLPTELSVDFCRVNSITHIVTRTVLNKCDKAFVFADCFENCLNNVDVSFFVVSANVINFTDFSVFNNHIDCLAVIVNIEPVTDIESFTVNGKLLISESFCNHNGDELFGELIRTVVV